MKLDFCWTQDWKKKCLFPEKWPNFPPFLMHLFIGRAEFQAPNTKIPQERSFPISLFFPRPGQAHQPSLLNYQGIAERSVHIRGFIPCRNCVALLHCSVLHRNCDVTALGCRTKVTIYFNFKCADAAVTGGRR